VKKKKKNEDHSTKTSNRLAVRRGPSTSKKKNMCSAWDGVVEKKNRPVESHPLMAGKRGGRMYSQDRGKWGGNRTGGRVEAAFLQNGRKETSIRTEAARSSKSRGKGECTARFSPPPEERKIPQLPNSTSSVCKMKKEDTASSGRKFVLIRL